MAFRLLNSSSLRFWIGLLAYLLIPIAIAAHTKQINYYSAVRLALNQNPRIAQVQAKIDAAKAAILETRGSGFPKLNMEINAARSNNPLDVFGYKLSQGNVSFADFGLAQYTGPASLNTVPNALNSPGYYNNINPGIKLAIPIYSGGETTAKIKSTQALLDAANHGSKAAQNQLAYDILQAYEGVRAAIELEVIAHNGVIQAKDYLRLTQSLHRQSIVIESDILQVKTYLRSAQINLQAAKDEVQNHLDAFHTLIGRPNSQLVPGEAVHFSKSTESVSNLIRQALHHNAQLHAMKSNMIASKANIDAANASNLPQLNLHLRHDWNGKEVGQGKPSDTVMLRLDWLLFSSGMQTGAVKKAIAQYKEASYQFDDMADSIRLALIKSKRAERLAEKQYQAHKEDARQAKAMVKQIYSRYGRGLVPLGELINSKMKLDQAKSQQEISRYNKILAQGRLLMITDQLLADNNRDGLG